MREVLCQSFQQCWKPLPGPENEGNDDDDDEEEEADQQLWQANAGVPVLAQIRQRSS
jgi:hypothetical protein